MRNGQATLWRYRQAFLIVALINELCKGQPHGAFTARFTYAVYGFTDK